MLLFFIKVSRWGKKVVALHIWCALKGSLRSHHLPSCCFSLLKYHVERKQKQKNHNTHHNTSHTKPHHITQFPLSVSFLSLSVPSLSVSSLSLSLSIPSSLSVLSSLCQSSLCQLSLSLAALLSGSSLSLCVRVCVRVCVFHLPWGRGEFFEQTHNNKAQQRNKNTTIKCTKTQESKDLTPGISTPNNGGCSPHTPLCTAICQSS